MGILNPNSTNYVHPAEPNLMDLHSAMRYNASGEPQVRVHVDGISLEGDVIVDRVKLWDGTSDLIFDMPNNDGETAPISLPTENHNMVFNGSTWDRMRGNIADGILTQISNDYLAISKDTNANSDSNRIFVNATGTVELGTTTLAALENITVTGSVSVSNFPATQAVTGTFWQATQPVSIATMPTTPVTGTFWQATQPISGTVTIQDGGGSITVDGSVSATVSGTVELGATTLSALETTTANQGTGGASAWRISANNTDNSSGNPIYVSANISNSTVTVAQSDTAVTAFDEPIAVELTPVIQADAQYGLDPDFWVTTKLRGGNVTVNANSTWEVSSGTSAGGYARLATAKYMSYQSGQGSLFRWTAAFTATGTTKDALGVDNIVQNTGPVDREDGYTFGYSGSTANDASRKIGILHRRNGKVEIRSLTFTTGPGGNQTATITLDSVAYTVAITSGNIYHAANQVATALRANTTATNTWDIEGCNGIVTFNYYSPGARTGTFSFSSTGSGTTAVAAFSQTAAGVSPSDTWTYVDQWDNQTIQFDPTKLNVFQIDMRWLGAGRVRFFMEDPTTGKLTLVHTRKSASQQIYPHINKPALRVAYRSGTTNPAITPSQDVIVRGSSVMTGVQGIRTQTGSSQGRYNIDSTTRAKDTVWHLMSVQNPFVRSSGVNKASLMMQTLTVAAQGQDPSVIYVVKDAFGLSDVLAYIAIPNTTPAMFAQYSISAISATLDTQRIANVQTLGINGTATFDLGAYNLSLSPGETVSVFISSGGALTRTAVGLTWLVD